MRRGVEFGAKGDDDSAALAMGGSIESKNGKDSATPTPRMKWRREMAGRVEIEGA
jgi:hypothetical protein